MKNVKSKKMKASEVKGKTVKASKLIRAEDIRTSDIEGKGRVLHFVNAGKQDVSEVVISSGIHTPEVADWGVEISYKISYGSGSSENPLSVREEFAKAADAILVDAKNIDKGRIDKGRIDKGIDKGRIDKGRLRKK